MDESKKIARLNKKIKELEERIEKKDKEIRTLRKENKKRGKEKTKARGRAKKIITQHEQLIDTVKDIEQELVEELCQTINKYNKEEPKDDFIVIFDAQGKERRIKKC